MIALDGLVRLFACEVSASRGRGKARVLSDACTRAATCWHEHEGVFTCEVHAPRGARDGEKR